MRLYVIKIKLEAHLPLIEIFLHLKIILIL